MLDTRAHCAEQSVGIMVDYNNRINEKMYLHLHINKKKYFMITVVFWTLFLLAYIYTNFIVKIQPINPLLFHDCAFKNTFHLYCPGCGGTRAVDALLHLRILSSFFYHPLVIYVVICFCFFHIKIGLQLKKQNGDADIFINTACIFGALILVLTFFVVRNLLLVYGGIDYIGELKMYWL